MLLPQVDLAEDLGDEGLGRSSPERWMKHQGLVMVQAISAGVPGATTHLSKYTVYTTMGVYPAASPLP